MYCVHCKKWAKALPDGTCSKCGQSFKPDLVLGASFLAHERRFRELTDGEAEAMAHLGRS